MKLRLLCALALLLAACEREDIVVARLAPSEPEEEEEHEGHHDKPCLSNADCNPETFCERKGCAQPVGFCERRPVSCAIGDGPVCGCNGSIYPSECIRRAAGETASRPAPCGPP